MSSRALRVLPLASVLLVLSACGNSAETGASTGSAAAGSGGSSMPLPDAGGVAPDAGGAAPDAGGPRVMVRIGHVVQPDFLNLDACFGEKSSTATTWTGPVWHADWAHGATWGRITSYQRIAPNPQVLRLVAHGAADCNTPIVGLADQVLDVPLVASDHDAWFTLMALGSAGGTGAAALRIQTLVDRATVADTPFGLRLVTLDPAKTPVELGSNANSDNSGYVQRIKSASFGAPSAYTSWTPDLPAPLYFGFKVFLEGQTAGAPLVLGDRAQSEATTKGSWTVFLMPPRSGTGDDQWSFCTDGADGPRLCFPCGIPSCEGQ